MYNNEIMRRLYSKTIFLSLLSSSVIAASDAKISTQLERELSENDTVELYVLLKNTHDIKQHNNGDRIHRLKKVVEQLKANSRISQAQLHNELISKTDQYRYFWVNNSLWAKMDSQMARQFLQSDHIDRAYSNKKQSLQLVKGSQPSPEVQPSRAIEWNISMINAPMVWDQGFRGQNVVIAGQDTGYAWQHESLINAYAGWNGNSVDHNYSWHDAISNPANTCEDAQNNPASCDDNGHGTHTMGIMVGDDGKGNQIGVAPDARWIGCRNMDRGNGTPATYTDCFQFFLEPTDINGNNPDINRAPHIINNSWGCIVSEGCTEPDALESIVNNVVDAGILVVTAAGNDGPGCNTVNTPTAIYNKALTIGSTTINDTISGFSSKGGVTVDGSNRIKPDLVAPGSQIRSADLEGGYFEISGTSMAAPHVAGVAALMISANPAMAGRPKILKNVILQTSQTRTSTQSCNGVSGSQIPNNTYGWGRIDANAAVERIIDTIYIEGFEEY